MNICTYTNHFEFFWKRITSLKTLLTYLSVSSFCLDISKVIFNDSLFNLVSKRQLISRIKKVRHMYQIECAFGGDITRGSIRIAQFVFPNRCSGTGLGLGPRLGLGLRLGLTLTVKHWSCKLKVHRYLIWYCRLINLSIIYYRNHLSLISWLFQNLFAWRSNSFTLTHCANLTWNW